MGKDLTRREKLKALVDVAKFKPVYSFLLAVLGVSVAFLEGIGLSFIIPIVEVAQNGESIENSVFINAFISIYSILGIPFSLAYLIVGVSLVMTFRYSMSFLTSWLKLLLSKDFEKNLREKTFKAALNGEISYFDKKGSDKILNAIITETGYSKKVISRGVNTMQMIFLILIYLAVMFFVSPVLTLIAAALLGGITLFLRYVLEPAVVMGSKVADANERVQESVQAGTQGIRDIKLFGLGDKIYSEFQTAIQDYKKNEVNLGKNKAAIKNFYKMSAAITLFSLIYIGFEYTELTLGSLGIFLIAMFQLAPTVSELNSEIYDLEGYLSHYVRTQEFLSELNNKQENIEGEEIKEITNLNLQSLEFNYRNEEKVIDEVDLKIEKGEFVAFVGPSGAGKSTLVSLIARMYNPNKGHILCDGKDIREYSLDTWRSRIAFVRQQCFIFNATLEENVRIGDPSASKDEIKKVCELAKVDEFLNQLPNGYCSNIGDNGVKLSGGQRQRVALARALLKDADFLILDEATSDLDSDLEKQVQKNIESSDKQYGIIAVAHRLSTIKNADRIYTLEKGNIVEQGSHRELLEQSGKYAELYKIQSKES